MFWQRVHWVSTDGAAVQTRGSCLCLLHFLVENSMSGPLFFLTANNQSAVNARSWWTFSMQLIKVNIGARSPLSSIAADGS